MTLTPEAWPAPSPDRLADAVAGLAERVGEGDIRAQLHALSGVLRNLGRETLDGEARGRLGAELADAVTAGDERRTIVLMRELARIIVPQSVRSTGRQRRVPDRGTPGEAVTVGRGLAEWLRGRGVGATVEALGRATVGLSQETWFVRVTTATGDVEAVLRLPTPASGTRAIVTNGRRYRPWPAPASPPRSSSGSTTATRPRSPACSSS